MGRDLIREVTYEINMSEQDIIEFQLKMAFGDTLKNFSKNEIGVLAVMYLVPNLITCKKRIVELNLRTNAKSIETNDLKKFKDSEIVSIENGEIIFNENIILNKNVDLFKILINKI